jgi:hypothetical protein
MAGPVVMNAGSLAAVHRRGEAGQGKRHSGRKDGKGEPGTHLFETAKNRGEPFQIT